MVLRKSQIIKENSCNNVHPQCTALLLWEAAVKEDGGGPAAQSQVSNAVSSLLHFVASQQSHYNALKNTGIHTVQTLSRENTIHSQREVFLSFRAGSRKKEK